MFSNFLLPISRQALHTIWPHLRILGNLDGIFPWPYLVGDNFGKLNRNFRVHCAQWSALLRLERWSTMQKKLVEIPLSYYIKCQVLTFEFWHYYLVKTHNQKNLPSILSLILNNYSIKPKMNVFTENATIWWLLWWCNFSLISSLFRIYICQKFLKTFRFQL